MLTGGSLGLRLMITLFLQAWRILSKYDTNEKEKKERFATEANEANEDKVQHKKKIDDEAKKLKTRPPPSPPATVL
jgi:hypothetical protein